MAAPEPCLLSPHAMSDLCLQTPETEPQRYCLTCNAASFTCQTLVTALALTQCVACAMSTADSASPSKTVNHAGDICIRGSNDQVQHVVCNVAAQLIWHEAHLFEVGSS